MLGYTKDELTQLSLLDVTHPADVEGNRETLQKLAAGETEHYVIEKRYVRKDRSFVWVNVTGARAAVHGKPDYLVVAVEDITARKKVEEDLKRTVESSFHQATHDMLTGVANRTSFNARLKEALSYAKRDEHQVAVHVLDLDGFKAINDTLGHHVGDLLLKDAAMRLTAKVRATDMPPSVKMWLGDSIGRWEGGTLEVDTTNFRREVHNLNSGERLHVVERFTRLDARTLRYRVTVEDPDTWAMPWTAEWSFRATEARLFPVECHEGNYAIENFLRGARAEERRR